VAKIGSLENKIEILGDASKFDVCASMASSRTPRGKNRIGKPDKAGICHAFTPDGRCISLFKVLMTNKCGYDCLYCKNSCKNQKSTAMFEPDELVKAFIGLYLRNYVEGLFLSSGVWRNTTETTEKMIEALSIIRKKYLFQGYLHIKILPGTEREYIKQLQELADRVSLNIELPTASLLSEVSSTKNYYSDILKCQNYIKQNIDKGLTPAGQTTQFVIGSTDETDREVIERLLWEYQHLDIRRGYFSAFIPVKGTGLGRKKIDCIELKRRENFLYRVDWLARRYHYKREEIYSILNEEDMIPLAIDPKIAVALKDDRFPIDVNEASYTDLLRVPGIGETSARRIINLRKVKKKITNYRDLRRVGSVVQRAKPFLIVDGKKMTRLIDYLD
jgi:putative DNA modification/repair radical SAM protein